MTSDSLLGLVLRGLWARRGVSTAILVIAALVAGGAAMGPLFLRAADESALRDTLNQGLSAGRKISDTVKGVSKGYDPLTAAEDAGREKLATRPTLRRLLGSSVGSVELGVGAGTVGATPEFVVLAYREGVCAHVEMIAGGCAEQPGTAMVSGPTAAIKHWRVGQQLALGERTALISGFYAPLDPTGDFWAGHPYFAAFGDQNRTGSTLDSVFAPLDTLRAQPGYNAGNAEVERYLDISLIRLTDLPALQAELRSYGELGVFATIEAASAVMAKLIFPVVVVEAQLLALGWLILFLVVANAAEARGPEIALAKLRGWSAGSTLAFGLLDTLLLVAVAIPAGVGLGWLWVAGLGRLQLAPGTPVELTGSAWLAALGAGVGAAVAAALAASSTLRRPIVEQWRRATRRAPPRLWLADAVVTLAAIGGLVLLAARGAIGGGRVSAYALIAPGLLVLAAALVGSRVLPGLCRAAYGPTRRRGWVSAILAVRQLGRRPSTLRLGLVLAVAFGLVSFGVGAFTVVRANTHDRAWTEIGAASVLSVLVPPDQDLGETIARLDPSGRQAAVVTEVTDYRASPSVLLEAVQPDRYAAVSFWRPDFGAPKLADLTDRLTVPTAPVVELVGDAIRIDLDSQLRAGGTPVLVADVVQPSATSGSTEVLLGRLRPGRHVLQAELPCRPRGCRLAALRVERAAGDA